MNATISRPLQTLVWRHIALRLPADWEMLQFASDFEKGRCAFADRYQFRAEMSWRAVRGEPDYDRMVSDYVHKLEQDKHITGAERAKKQGWHGFFGTINREFTSRFGRYYPELGCLVEMVFLWPDARDLDLENTLLASVEPCPPQPGGVQRWQAFGMNLTPPAHAAIEGCTAQPARAEFTFTDTKTGNTWQAMRLGMLGSWFDGHLEPWLQNNLGRSVHEVRYTHRTQHGNDAIFATGLFKPDGIHLRKGTFEALAWLDAADGRLYCAKKYIRRAGTGTEQPVENLLAPARPIILTGA